MVMASFLKENCLKFSQMNNEIHDRAGSAMGGGIDAENKEEYTEITSSNVASDCIRMRSRVQQ